MRKRIICRSLSALSLRAAQLLAVPEPPKEYKALHTIRKLSSMAEEVKGQSGRQHLIEQVLQDKGIPLGCVYRATYVAASAILVTV